VFLGEYQHSVDDKSRLVMPSKFRHLLAGGLVVTRGLDRCLDVFPMDRWEVESARVSKLARADARNRNFARSFYSAATHQEMDKQGRIQLSPKLRAYAGLGKDVVIIGMAERFEIWDTETWATVSDEADELFAGIEEALTEGGI